MATETDANAFLLFKTAPAGQLQLHIKGNKANFEGQDYKLNAWHTMCSTWDSGSGLGRLWLDAWPSSPKLISSGSPINGTTIITLAQEQDSFGGRFDEQQSLVGMLSDVHMWNYVLSPCEIQRYTSELNFTPGNIINWRALEYQTKGSALLGNKEADCIH
ncbi:C-reactive protein-like [Aplochiton taeniatus]